MFFFHIRTQAPSASKGSTNIPAYDESGRGILPPTRETGSPPHFANLLLLSLAFMTFAPSVCAQTYFQPYESAGFNISYTPPRQVQTYRSDNGSSMLPAPPAITAHDVCRVALRGTFTGTGAGSCQIGLGESNVPADDLGNIDGIAFLYSNIDYELVIEATQMQALTLNIQAPAGYYVWIDETPRKQIHLNSSDPVVMEVYQIQIRTHGGGAPGTGGSVKLGEELAWGVNLGRLYNGSLAGSLVMRAELDPAYINRGSIASRGVTQQVSMIYDNKSLLRQVEAPEMFVDINDVVNPSNASEVIGFTADFYPLEAMGAADDSGIRAINPGSEYYIRHTVKRAGASLDELEVTSSHSGANVLITNITQQAGIWTKTIAGTSIASEQIVETVESSAVGNECWETTTIKDGADNVARMTKRIYNKSFTWNELMPTLAFEQGTLTDVIVDPEGAALTTHYEYYTDATLKGSYAQIKSITHPDGSWAKYEYYEEGEAGYGLMKREYHPWRDGPAAPDAATVSNCHVIEYTYIPDPSYAPSSTEEQGEPNLNGVSWLLASRIETINGVTTAKKEITHTFSEASVFYEYHENAKLWTQEIHTWPDGGINAVPLVSKITRYKTGHEGALGVYDGLPYSTTQPDGSKTVYLHLRKSTSNAIVTAIAFHGMEAPADGLVYHEPFEEGTDTDGLYLKPGHSMLTISTKENGRIKREQTHIWQNSDITYIIETDLSMIGRKLYTYNASGRLIRIDSDNATLYEATWQDGFKTSERGADGIEYNYSPDAVMRVSRAVKTAAPGTTIGETSIAAQPYVATDYTYNAAGNILSRAITDDGSLQLQETFTYDQAGRLTSSITPSGTTTVAYGTRTHTTTCPGGATHTVQALRDGQVESETGTAIVGVHYDYGITPEGFRWIETKAGSATSNAKARNTYDWSGRLRTTETPAISGTTIAGVNTTNHVYDILGRLVRTETPGLAPTLYEYDQATGVLRAQGLLCGGGDPLTGDPRTTLDPALGDRVIRFENQFACAHATEEGLSDNVIWYHEQKSYYLADGSSGTSLLRSHTRVRISDFSPALASEVEFLDAHGNKTVQATSINRANRLVTHTTSVPGSNIPAISRVYNGLPVSSQDALGQSATYDYDPLGRPVRTHRPGKTAIETVYDPVTGRVQKTQFADNARTLIASYEYDSAGRVSKTADAAGATVFATYNDRGQLLTQYGTGAIPVACTYDDMGRLAKQTTWRGAPTNTTPSTSSPDANHTTYQYLSDLALLTQGTDALGNATGYSYDKLGRLTALQRARKLSDHTTPVTVTYAYDPMTGELTGKSYNDTTTPALSYAYNGFGQLATVTDALGTRAFDYAGDATGSLLSETLPAYYQDPHGSPPSAPGLRHLKYDYDTGAPHAYGSAYAPLKGRLKTATLLDSTDTAEAAATYWYLGNAMPGRIEVADPAAAGSTRAFQYSWMPQQPALLQQAAEMQTGLTRTNTYADDYWDSPTRVATGFSGVPAPGPLAANDMTYDTLGRLATVQQSGAAFAGYGEPIHHKYTYNLRGQLTAARSYMGATADDTRPMPGRQHTFGFDNAGARTAGSHDDSLPQAETVNALGQITQKENRSIHVSGVAVEGATVAVRNGEGLSTLRSGASAGRFWSIEVSLDAATNTGAAKANANVYLGKPAASPGEDNVIKTIPLSLFMLPKKETFLYDPDGNLLSDGQWDYAYDAENRLVSMQTKDALLPVLNPKPGGERPLKITFVYDHLSRRAGKKVQEMIGGIWQDGYHHLYVYNGSALIAEIDATTRQVLRTFAWGATGELLMINDRADTLGPQTYLPVHNATGSVTAMVRAVDNTFAATYEYDPNGNLLRASGEYAKSNPFTYGGGWMDWETGLINAGSVYYSARLGRFINTAPSGGGDGMPACYGVAPTAGHLSSRIYAQPPARRSTGAAGWISVDPDAWAAYETAYAPALAAHEAALDEYQRSNRGGVPIEDYSADEFVADFLAWAFGQYFTGTHGSFDTGLSDNYGNYAFDGSKMKYKDGERPGYFDANSDEWVYPDGTRVSFSVEFKEMTALAYQISAGGDWYAWGISYDAALAADELKYGSKFVWEGSQEQANFNQRWETEQNHRQAMRAAYPMPERGPSAMESIVNGFSKYSNALNFGAKVGIAIGEYAPLVGGGGAIARNAAAKGVPFVTKFFANLFGKTPTYRTWNQFQAGTRGLFSSRAEAGKAWTAHKNAQASAAKVYSAIVNAADFSKGAISAYSPPFAVPFVPVSGGWAYGAGSLLGGGYLLYEQHIK